jgi:signal transduction histidine kinase/CheY-like chemotaxis protein
VPSSLPEAELKAELDGIRDKLGPVAAPLALLESIVAWAPFALQLCDASGRCLVVNRAFRELFGWQPPADYNVLTDEQARREGVLPLLQRAFAGEALQAPPAWYEQRQLGEGRRVAIEAVLLPVFDAERAVSHVVIMFKDVTSERVAREVAAREAAARRASERTREWLVQLQHVTSLLSEAVMPSEVAHVILDHGLTALGAQHGLLAVTGDEGQDLVLLGSRGFGARELLEWQDFDTQAQTPLADAIRSKTPVWIEGEAEFRERYPDLGERAEALSWCMGAVPLISKGRAFGALAADFPEPHGFQDEEKNFVLHLARQCAQALERARLYREAKEAQVRSEEATRAKDEFLSVVSHELRTPLNAILGWCHMMHTMRENNPSIVERGLQVIERNARAQVTIIEDILEMSRIITGKFRLAVQPVDLRSVVSAAVESVRLSSNAKGLKLIAEVPAGAVVLGDADRLQQIVWNLLSNAIKFTPQGGTIDVKLRVAEGNLSLTVQDTGQGIAQRDLPYVFDRFRQVDSSPTRAKGGLGLGLAIVRHLVEAHGGRVRADSGGIGRGACFEVELPLAPPELSRVVLPSESLPPPSPEDSEPRSGPNLNGLDVLVVDDEPDAAEIVGMLLGQRGAHVRLANSAAQGLRELQSATPHVLVSDIGMPEVDGLSFLRQVRGLPSSVSRIPAIALTAYASPGDAHRALEAGYLLHISKPVDPDRLVRAVARAAAAR